MTTPHLLDASTPHSAAGWYVNPNNPTQWRYFNGTGWTDQVADRTQVTHHQPLQRYVYERAAVFVAAMAVLWNFPIRSLNPWLCLIPIGLAGLLTYIADRRAIRVGASRRVTSAACILTLIAAVFLLVNLVKLL